MSKIRSIYLIGSMRNPEVQIVANQLREAGFEVFDDWQSPGPEADEYWQKYEKARGRKFREALAGPHAQSIFNLDRNMLKKYDAAVLVAPAGKSAHLELGYKIGLGEPGFILMDGEPERFDIMYGFATGIFLSLAELLEGLRTYEYDMPECYRCDQGPRARKLAPNRKRGTS
jgi:nucleoside 2-deoxyribosyltransferase